MQAAGENFTFFQTRSRDYESLDMLSNFVIDDGVPPFVYHQDYAEFSGTESNMGMAFGPIRFRAMREITRVSYFGRYIITDELDFSGEILLVLCGM